MNKRIIQKKAKECLITKYDHNETVSAGHQEEHGIYLGLPFL